jgi:hypothetical protein
MLAAANIEGRAMTFVGYVRDLSEHDIRVCMYVRPFEQNFRSTGIVFN